jgi:hypothetical protein
MVPDVSERSKLHGPSPTVAEKIGPDVELVPLVIARHLVARSLEINRKEAELTIRQAARVGLLQVVDSKRKVLDADDLMSFASMLGDEYYLEDELDNFIAQSQREVSTLATKGRRTGRRQEWPWEILAFAAGRWSQANPGASNAAVAEFVRQEAKRLTGKRPPSAKHSEQKVGEWKLALEEN